MIRKSKKNAVWKAVNWRGGQKPVEYRGTVRPVFFEKDLEIDEVRNLISELAAIDTDRIVIYFKSIGGRYFCAMILLDYLTRLAYEKQISLVAYQHISFSALLFFFLLPPEIGKSLMRGTSGTAHLFSYDFDYKAFGFNNDEIAKIYAGKEVGLSPKRMGELLSYQNSREIIVPKGTELLIIKGGQNDDA